MKIRDSVVFVTGANRGLGLAFAEESIKRGARKVYAGVRTPTGRDTPGVIEVKLDVTDPASVAAAAARCGDTTLLINNAGIRTDEHTSELQSLMRISYAAFCLKK